MIADFLAHYSILWTKSISLAHRWVFSDIHAIIILSKTSFMRFQSVNDSIFAPKLLQPSVLSTNTACERVMTRSLLSSESFPPKWINFQTIGIWGWNNLSDAWGSPSTWCLIWLCCSQHQECSLSVLSRTSRINPELWSQEAIRIQNYRWMSEKKIKKKAFTIFYASRTGNYFIASKV